MDYSALVSSQSWLNMVGQFIREVRVTQFPEGVKAIQMFKALIKKYTVNANGPSSRPGYICLIRKGNEVRFGLSRRPKEKLKRVKVKGEQQEMIWYGYTDNMLSTKKDALDYFSNYRTTGDWLNITPHMAMIYFKRKTKE